MQESRTFQRHRRRWFQPVWLRASIGLVHSHPVFMIQGRNENTLLDTVFLKSSTNLVYACDLAHTVPSHCLLDSRTSSCVSVASCNMDARLRRVNKEIAGDRPPRSLCACS
jgi:hypothetical protein